MFDNFINKLKNQANLVSDSFKNKTDKLTDNISNFKTKISTKSAKTEYASVLQNDEWNLSPRAYTSFDSNFPSFINTDNMEWVPYFPEGYDNSIIERFIRVITINDDDKHEYKNRRTDREEIRRRLAMGNEEDYYNGCDRPGRKPSLQARLQSGMNLQICFMNETASDTESPSSDSESPISEKFNSMPTKLSPRNVLLNHKSPNPKSLQPRPVSLPLGNTPPLLQPFSQPMTEADFFARQARLQTEARMALAQAKEMAHMQMEVERQRQKKSPITEMIRSSLEKVGIPFPEERRRVSRQILTEMNVTQLQLIVNDLHTQIEMLNENLVRFLMNRDDLHMEQDSMLVDIEDLTRYLGAKEQIVKDQKSTQNNNNPPPSPAPASPLSAINNTVKPRLHRIASLVKK